MSRFPRPAVLLLAIAALWVTTGCGSEPKIGAVISRTGQAAPYGEKITQGIDLALAEVNAAGGFQGTPVSVVYRDDGSDPARGKEAALDLIENEDTRLLIGAVSSQVTLAISEVCADKKAVLLSPSASAPQVSEAGEYVFRNYPSDVIEGTAMADFAKNRGIKSVVVFAAEGGFGDGLQKVFRRQFESRSRKVVETFPIAQGATDFSDDVRKILEIEPQGIYIIAYMDEMVPLLQTLRENRIEAQLLGSSAVTQDLPARAGEAAEGLVYAQPSLDLENAPTKTFVEAFRAKYGEEPDLWAAQGYDALHIMVAALEEAKQLHPDSVKLGLLNLDHDGAGGRTAFNENGDVTRYPTFFVIRDGSRVDLETFESEGGKLRIPEAG